jgi:hypothetical protein
MNQHQTTNYYQAEDTEIRDHAEEQSVELDLRNVFS